MKTSSFGHIDACNITPRQMKTPDSLVPLALPVTGGRAGAFGAFPTVLGPRTGGLSAFVGRAVPALRDLWQAAFAGPAQDGSATRAVPVLEVGEGKAETAVRVALVGAGPGSKDLITLRGVQRLQVADVIFYDRLVDPELLDFARPEAQLVYVGKAPGRHSWPQDRICDALVASALEGKRVVRLKCGDPGVFARGTEEADALNCADIAFEIVPGVTAASAASAAAGGFLTERGKIDTLVLTTGRTEDSNGEADWIASLRPGSKVAVYMGVAEAMRIEASLARLELADHVQVEIVSDAQMPSQRVLRCAASQIAQTLRDNGIKNRSIIFLSLPKGCAQKDANALSLGLAVVTPQTVAAE